MRRSCRNAIRAGDEMRWTTAALATTLVAALSACGAEERPTPPPASRGAGPGASADPSRSPGPSRSPEPGWAGTWAVGVQVGSTGFERQTLRQIVHTSIGGDRARLRLSNQFGAAPLTVTG